MRLKLCITILASSFGDNRFQLYFFPRVSNILFCERERISSITALTKPHRRTKYTKTQITLKYAWTLELCTNTESVFLTFFHTISTRILPHRLSYRITRQALVLFHKKKRCFSGFLISSSPWQKTHTDIMLQN